MSATDELRRMLDERGVEWKAPNSCLRDEMTSWAAGRFDYEAFEVPEPDGTFLLTAAHQDDLTPEQAIAATLGGNGKSRWHELFGTPERAARTSWYMLMCKHVDCNECPISDGCDIATDIDCDDGEVALLEWLRGDAE